MHRAHKIRQRALEIVHGLHVKYENPTKCRPQNPRGINRLTVLYVQVTVYRDYLRINNQQMHQVSNILIFHETLRV